MIPETRLPDMLPRLRDSPFRITSDPTGDYNCIAWALGDDERWWSPVDNDAHWPTGLQRYPSGTIISVDDVMQAFASEGFVECKDISLEEGYERVAIFADDDGFTHVSLQLPTGSWTSKLGKHWDIEHELDAVAGFDSSWPSFRYGEIALIMRRPRVSPGEGANLQ